MLRGSVVAMPQARKNESCEHILRALNATCKICAKLLRTLHVLCDFYAHNFLRSRSHWLSSQNFFVLQTVFASRERGVATIVAASIERAIGSGL